VHSAADTEAALRVLVAADHALSEAVSSAVHAETTARTACIALAASNAHAQVLVCDKHAYTPHAHTQIYRHIYSHTHTQTHTHSHVCLHTLSLSRAHAPTPKKATHKYT